jgi:hypothetical protein
MSYTCTKCDPSIDFDTEGGLKRHLTRKHGGYYVEDLRSAGVSVNQRDIARSLDSGNTSIDSVIASAPDTESSGKVDGAQTNQKRTSKEAREKLQELEEFRRLRPQLIDRWKRRLRIPYSMWARLANDPEIMLPEKELEEGATLHVDFCEAMGWLKAGKIEAMVDLTLWHGGTILSRSQFGKSLIASINPPIPEKK